MRWPISVALFAAALVMILISYRQQSAGHVFFEMPVIIRQHLPHPASLSGE